MYTISGGYDDVVILESALKTSFVAGDSTSIIDSAIIGPRYGIAAENKICSFNLNLNAISKLSELLDFLKSAVNIEAIFVQFEALVSHSGQDIPDFLTSSCRSKN